MTTHTLSFYVNVCNIQYCHYNKLRSNT